MCSLKTTSFKLSICSWNRSGCLTRAHRGKLQYMNNINVTPLAVPSSTYPDVDVSNIFADELHVPEPTWMCTIRTADVLSLSAGGLSHESYVAPGLGTGTLSIPVDFERDVPPVSQQQSTVRGGAPVCTTAMGLVHTEPPSALRCCGPGKRIAHSGRTQSQDS